jgi:hypothetical protein
MKKKGFWVGMLVVAFFFEFSHVLFAQTKEESYGITLLTSSDYSTKIDGQKAYPILLSNDGKIYLINLSGDTKYLTQTLVADYANYETAKRLKLENLISDFRKSIDYILRGKTAYEATPIYYDKENNNVIYLITNTINNAATLIDSTKAIGPSIFPNKKNMDNKLSMVLLQLIGLGGLAFEPNLIDKQAIALIGVMVIENSDRLNDFKGSLDKILTK